MKIQYIYIMGDVHGDWRSLNTFINKKIRQNKGIKENIKNNEVEVLIFQAGDFGWFPNADGVVGFDSPRKVWYLDGIKNKVEGITDNIVKIYFCPGNHENWEDLYRIQNENPDKKFIEVLNGVYFATFGSIFTLLNNTSVMFCGGAYSIDECVRTPGIDWWPDEVITMRDMYSLPDPKSTKVDWVISHTCPDIFKYSLFTHRNSRKFDDVSTQYLQNILEMFSPNKWWFGHFHRSISGISKGCEWRCLQMLGGSGQCYEEIIIKSE